MTYRHKFMKIICPGYDEICVSSLGSQGNEQWLSIEMKVGNDVSRVEMTLRSDEAVRDLHYALSRYLDGLDRYK